MPLRSPLFLPALILAGCAALLLGAWGFRADWRPAALQTLSAATGAALPTGGADHSGDRSGAVSVLSASSSVAASGLIAAAAFLAAKHVGVEFGWWQGPMDCSGRVQTIGSADELFSLERRTAPSRPTSCLELHGDGAPARRAAAASVEPARAVALGSSAGLGPKGGTLASPNCWPGTGPESAGRMSSAGDQTRFRSRLGHTGHRTDDPSAPMPDFQNQNSVWFGTSPVKSA